MYYNFSYIIIICYVLTYN